MIIKNFNITIYGVFWVKKLSPSEKFYFAVSPEEIFKIEKSRLFPRIYLIFVLWLRIRRQLMAGHRPAIAYGCKISQPTLAELLILGGYGYL